MFKGSGLDSNKNASTQKKLLVVYTYSFPNVTFGVYLAHDWNCNSCKAATETGHFSLEFSFT